MFFKLLGGRKEIILLFIIKKSSTCLEKQEGTMKVAVVGATGLVGTKMLQVLAERNFPVTELIPVPLKDQLVKKSVSRVRNLR